MSIFSAENSAFYSALLMPTPAIWESPSLTPPLSPTPLTFPETTSAAFLPSAQVFSIDLGKTYARAELDPQSLSFGEPSAPQLLKTFKDLRPLLRTFNANDTQQLAALPAESLHRFEAFSRRLGFNDFKQMQYQLRNLPSEHLDQWIKNTETALNALPPESRKAEKLTEIVTDQLTHSVEQATERLFTEANAPQPRFEAKPPAVWTAAARLSAFNAFAEIRQSQSAETFRRAAVNPHGKPLTLMRQSAPAPDPEANALQMLSQMMKVAEYDKANGHINLTDGAVEINPRELLANRSVQYLLQRIHQPNPSPDKQAAIRSVQELLNFARPPERHLNLSGQHDQATQNALAAFDLQQSIMSATDILDDDRRLSIPQKRSEQLPLNALIQRLQQGETPEKLQSELGEQITRLLKLPELQTQTRERLEQLNTQLKQPLNRQFDQNLLEKLTHNWYGIIDGGQQLDFTEQAIVHEVGHNLHDLPGILDNWERISWDEDSSAQTTADMRETLNALGQKGFASAYGRTNAKEDFAEAYRVFTYQPERLLQHSLLKFVFMASITDAYRGKEQQMIDLVRKSGYNNQQLKEAVLHLRGHLPSALQQEARKTVGVYATALKIATPVFGHSLNWMLEATGFKEHIVDTVSKMNSPEKIVRFDPTVASGMPNLDALLDIEQNPYDTPINNSGYLLEKFSRLQAVLFQPDSSTTARRQASEQLQKFATEGLESFAPIEQRSFAPEAIAFLSGENATAHRAVLLALSKILGKSYAVQKLNAPNASSGSYTRENLPFQLQQKSELQFMQAFFKDVQQNPEKLRQALGDELYQALPPAFLTMVQEADFVDKITGHQGQISIGASNIFDYTCTELQTRTQNQAEFKRQLQHALNFIKKGQGERAYRFYQQMTTNYGNIIGKPVKPLSQAEFEQRATQLLNSLNPTPTVSEPTPALQTEALPSPPPNPQHQFLNVMDFDTSRLAGLT